MKVRSLKDIERDIRKETEKANTAAQYDMYASSVDDMFRAALAVAVADVLIMARQLRLLLGSEDIDKIIDAKLNRQIQRIKEEENNG